MLNYLSLWHCVIAIKFKGTSSGFFSALLRAFSNSISVSNSGITSPSGSTCATKK